MTDQTPKPTPAVERAAAALAYQRYPDQTVQDDPEVIETLVDDALAALAAALDVEEMTREIFALHRPIINLTVGAHLLARQPRGQHGIVGCSCMDRVFINGQESWDEHLADVTSTHLLGSDQ